MYRFILVTCILVNLAIGMPSEQEFPFGRIVNGVKTTIESHPYQVSIQTTSGSHFCGGSIIDSDTIVTAAHCMQRYTAKQFQVRLGSTYSKEGGEVVSVRAFKFHEKYDANLMVNDVAIIKLSSPVRQTAKVRYIELADVTPANGTPAVVTGWGTTCFLFCGSTSYLQEVDVNIVQRAECGSAPYKYGSAKILETMLCGYNLGKDACQGDSGGPLVTDGKLVGIVSWGSGCGANNYPGVYCDVASVRDWILKTAKEL